MPLADLFHRKTPAEQIKEYQRSIKRSRPPAASVGGVEARGEAREVPAVYGQCSQEQAAAAAAWVRKLLAKYSDSSHERMVRQWELACQVASRYT